MGWLSQGPLRETLILLPTTTRLTSEKRQFCVDLSVLLGLVMYWVSCTLLTPGTIRDQNK